jgi:hypothetical protein
VYNHTSASGPPLGSDPLHYDHAGSLFVLNRICIRRFVNVFMVMYRHLHLHTAVVLLTPPQKTLSNASLIKLHHVLASADEFNSISMHFDTHLAGRLSYMHDFPGMYNCISQVVYFQDTDYERARPERVDIAAINLGTLGPRYTLPCLLQLYPQAELLYEDDYMANFMHCNADRPARLKTEFKWVVMGTRVYLAVIPPDGIRHYGRSDIHTQFDMDTDDDIGVTFYHDHNLSLLAQLIA